MSNNGEKSPIPFARPPAAPGVPIVGQPFALVRVSTPVNATLTCNCGGAETLVTVVASIPAACPSCRKVYSVAFNPCTGQLQIQIGLPQPEQVVQ